MVIKLSRGRSVGQCISLLVRRSVRLSVSLSSALWKNSRSDPDAVWHHRSDGSGDEAGSGVLGIGPLEGVLLGRAIVTNGDFMVYVYDSATTRPSSQITLSKLVIIIIIVVISFLSQRMMMLVFALLRFGLHLVA